MAKPIRWIDLREKWGGRSSARGAVDLALHVGGFAVLFAIAHGVGTIWAYLAVAPFIGALQHGLVNLSHEAWHGLCFPSVRLNHWIGAWIYSYPVGIPYHHDRSRHLTHHSLVGKTNDPDWINYENAGRLPPGRLYVFFLGRLIGTQLVDTVVRALRGGAPRISVDVAHGPSVIREYASIALCQLLLLGVFTATGRPWEYLVLWIVPLATFASLFVAIRSFVEHAHVDDSPEPVARLSDFRPSTVEAFFLSPCHFHFHALHHAFPAVPHYRLRHLQRELEEGTYPGGRKPGYIVSLREWTRAIRARAGKTG